jgi:hypothetical protein
VVIKGPQNISSLGKSHLLRSYLYKCPCFNKATSPLNGVEEAAWQEGSFVLKVLQAWVPLSSAI